MDENTLSPGNVGASVPIAAAIDFGGTKTMVGLVHRDGSIRVSRIFPTAAESGPEQHLARCADTLSALLSEAGCSTGDLAGIGVTVPGLADPRQGILLHAPFLGWRDVPVRAALERYWPGIPVSVANDVNACALGEVMFGVAGAYNNVLWVTVSTGIGGGLIIDGDIYEGEHGFAGELGHVVVEWQGGAPCGCGNRGCLEAHASGTAITIAGIRARADSPADSPLRLRFGDAEDITAKTLALAAADGIEEARRIYRRAGTYLGRALSAAINVLNPGAVVIGGGVAQSYQLMEDAVREVIKVSVIGEVNRAIPIVRTALGYEAGLIGASALVWKETHG